MQHQVIKKQQGINIETLQGTSADSMAEWFVSKQTSGSDHNFSLDVLALKFLNATLDLQAIIDEHNIYLKYQPTLHLLSQKLMEIFKEAAGGNMQALLNASHSGETTLVAIIDMVENMDKSGSKKVPYRLHSELRDQLKELHDKYYKTELRL